MAFRPSPLFVAREQLCRVAPSSSYAVRSRRPAFIAGFAQSRGVSTTSAKNAARKSSTESVESFTTSNVMDLMSLKDRTIVITGAGRGIGLALGFAVAEAGGKVAIIDSASEPHEAYAKLKNICPDVRYYQSVYLLYFS